MGKKIFYYGLFMVFAGVGFMVATRDISTGWIAGCGATICALALLLDQLTLDWVKKFSEIQGQFNGTTDAVRACYAEIEVIKTDVRALNPSATEELEMRVENLEANSGLRVMSGTGISSAPTPYMPPKRKIEKV